MRRRLGAMILALGAVLSGCASTGLRDIRPPGPGPDEFLVLPFKPLDMPESFTDLPAPTPGGANRVDQNPRADAVAALGGRAAAPDGQGVPASDGALLAQTGRYGVPADTRASLEQADARFRKRQSRATRFRLFPVDRYEQAYRREALDPFAEARRFRRAGIPTPAAPPENE